MRGRVVRTLVTGTLLALVALVPAAHAAFPGQNGKIAYQTNVAPAGIWTMNPDGTGQAPLRAGFSPTWSPNGSHLLFQRGRDVLKMPADGSTETVVLGGFSQPFGPYAGWHDPAWSSDGTRLVTGYTEGTDDQVFYEWIHTKQVDAPGWGNNVAFGEMPTWSPYGSEIAFVADEGGTDEIHAVRPNGTGGRGIWGSNDEDSPAADPDYSPTGGQIVFAAHPPSWQPPANNWEIWVVSAAGGQAERLTNNTFGDIDPAWSPDGTKIAFASNRAGAGSYEIYTMNSDGTNPTRVTDFPAAQPSWQPLPYPNYVRPKGATPVRVSLVPTFEQCTAANREHGPPLAYGSCNPPAPESDQLTVGGSMTGFVRYKAIVGNPATTEVDEADIALHVQISDVREQGTFADYGGEVEAEAMARLTDRTAGDPATAVDVRFPLTTPCTPTAATNVGSTCLLTTTLDALIPDAITEGQRTVLQLGQVQVVDGGPDADTATEPNNVFLRQGVFVP